MPPTQVQIDSSIKFIMEPKDNHTSKASEIFVKVEINEGQWWQEGLSSEMKYKSEEFPISVLQNECVNSSHMVTESKSNITCRNEYKMEFKMEIKEEIESLELSPEVKSEPDKPCVSENKAKDYNSWIVGIDEDFPSRMSPRLQTESVHKFSNDATSSFPSTNSGANTPSDSDTISKYNLLNSSQQQKFTLAPDAKTCNSIEDCQMPHKCDICGKSFGVLSDLKQHSIKHEDSKLFNYEIDEQEHAKIPNLKHEGKRPHMCEICNKRFTRLSHLKCHILTHEGKRLHTCTICNKKFTQTSHLKRHTLIHEGKRPHKCEICKRTFIHRSALKQHELTHEGRRPHACEICNKRYTHVTTLKRHKLFHEGKKPYTCEICMKSFIQSSSLKEHKLIHEGKRPHICEICNKNFSNNSNLKRHKSTHEGKTT